MAEIQIVQTFYLETVAEVTDEELKILKSTDAKDQAAKAEIQNRLCETADDHADFSKWPDHAESMEWGGVEFMEEDNQLFDVG
jgi:hypothetical protein